MGNCLAPLRDMFGRRMTWRSDEPQRRMPSTPNGRPQPSESRSDPAMSDVHIREDHETDWMMCHTLGPVHTTNNLTRKQEIRAKDVRFNDAALNKRKIFKDNSGEPHPSGVVCPQSTWTTSQKELTDFKTKVLNLESELKEKKALIQKLNELFKDRVKDADMQALKLKLDKTLLLIEERDETLENVQLETSQWKTKCQKLEAQLALIEQKSAQESLTSGSYPDDRANPGMMEAACKVVDKATEDLVRVLHNMSVTKSFSLNSVELEQFLRQISPAHPAEFSRAIQVRYVWSHWICFHMFQGFEHAFFDADGGQLTSPLDSKKHALECFRNFQQKQNTSSLDFYNEGGLFQAFCTWKFQYVFPPWLVKQAFFPSSPDDTLFNESGRFNGDAEIVQRFMDVARAIWLLHELAFSFDPPATILRMTRGTPYDKQFHEPVIHGEDSDGMSQVVVLMIRPAFRIRNSTIRSRVFFTKNPTTVT